MRYERHIKDVDGIIAVEEISETEVRYLRFKSRIDKKAKIAIDEINEMTRKAKARFAPKPDPLDSLGLLGFQQQAAFAPMSPLANLAAQQQMPNPNGLFGLSGAFPGAAPFINRLLQ